MNTRLVFVSMIACATMIGCSESKEYDVSGQLTSTGSITGPISVEFFEYDKSDAESERESILAVTVNDLGPVAQKVEADPALDIVVVAIADADGDGKCTEGELWGEAELTKNEADDTIKAFTVDLKAQACPAAAAEE